jgi:hypothetical protein
MNYVVVASTSDSIDFGNCVEAIKASCGMGNGTRGIYNGGILLSGNAETDNMSYITIASTGNDTDFGNLSHVRTATGAVSNATRGIISGRVWSSGGGAASKQLDYVAIGSTGDGADFGDMYDELSHPMAFEDDTRGCWAGGDAGYPYYRQRWIAYVTIDSTGNSSMMGNLSEKGHFANCACTDQGKALLAMKRDSEGYDDDYLETITVQSSGGADSGMTLSVARRNLGAGSGS